MAWDVEGTKRKIIEAATAEFVASGPDGTTIERIAKRAGVNKERVYNYYGGKAELFAVVLCEHLAAATGSVPLDAADANEVAESAGRLYDFNREHPQFVRLLLWEALSHTGEVPDEEARRDIYQRRSATLEAGRDEGAITAALDADILHFLVLSLAGYWAVLPQVARMVTDRSGDDADEAVRRRTGVIEAARRLAEP